MCYQVPETWNSSVTVCIAVRTMQLLPRTYIDTYAHIHIADCFDMLAAWGGHILGMAPTTLAAQMLCSIEGFTVFFFSGSTGSMSIM